MKVTIEIEVQDSQQAEAAERALQQPDVLAFVIVCGVLQTLPSDRARQRALRYVSDLFEEERQSRRT